MDKRNIVLQKIQQALKESSKAPSEPDWRSSVFAQSNLGLLEQFIHASTAVQTLVKVYASSGEVSTAIHDYIQSQVQPSVIISTEAEAIVGKLSVSHLNQVDEALPADIGISTCDALCARTGSVLLSSANAGARTIGIYPHVHILIAFQSQLVKDIDEGLAFIQTKYNKSIPSMVSLVSGPSRTADIEKTLVLGAHGPKELYIYIIQDGSN